MSAGRPRIVASLIIASIVALLLAGAWLSRGFEPDGLFMPHSHCYLFNRELMWLHGGSDVLIGVSYVAISATLATLVLRARRELPFHWLMVAFAIFIIACGATHLMEVWTLTAENPRYWTSGWVKLVTAMASLATAIVLPTLVPRIIHLVESARLSAERQKTLERAYGEIGNVGGSPDRDPRSEDLATLVRELADAKAAAERANAAKDDFLAVLSHELRTPLTPALAAASDLEASDAVAPEGWREAIGIIRRNIELEARLVDDLLDVTRISRGKLRIQSAPVDLHAIVRDAVAIVDPLMREKQIEVAVDLGAAAHMVRGDAARLAQVFSNLLTNASKFTPDGGRVSVTSRNVGESVRVEVRDSGIGIAAEFLPRIFEKFRQAGDGTTRLFGGLGLGLNVARSLVEAHGGSIEAASDGRDLGATFSVTLPAYVGSMPASEMPSKPTSVPAPASPLRVLLVEDHDDTRAVLHRLLSRWGHEVHLAASVSEALPLLARHDFDLLLSDIGLPDGSGLEVVKALRQRGGHHAIAMSGFGMEGDRASSRAAGFDDHIVKPVAAERLREILQRLDRSGSQRS